MDNQDLNVVNDTQTGNVDSQQTETVNSEVNEPVNAGSGEVATPQPQEKQIQSAEENARFAEIRRKAEAEAETRTRDKMIAEMYGESHGIHTYADYQKAVAEQAEEARKEELRNQGIDPETFNKYVEENPVVRQAKELIEQQNHQKYLADQVKALETYSPGIDINKLDPSVVEEFKAGKPLVDAYIKYENQKLKSELEAFKKGSTTLQANQTNAATSTGSVTGNGSNGGEFLTKEQVEANRSNPSWIKANLSRIEESMKKW